MTKNEQQATISGMSHEGRGITRINGKTVFVDGALPDEEATLRFIKRHKRFDEAVAVDIQQPHADRVPALCEAFGQCGGCNLQHLAADKQLVYKQQWFSEQLEHHGQCQPQHWLPPLTGPTQNYRHKARLSVRFVAKKGHVVVGFREKNGRFVTDLHHCPILADKLTGFIEPLKKLIQQLHAREHIAQLEVAQGDTTAAIIVRHLETLDEHDQQIWLTFAKTQPCELYMQPKGPNTIHRVWPQTGEERLYYRLPDQDLRLAFHPSDFIQINTPMNQKMVNQALSLLELKPQDRVLDLFCGLGNFSLPIAKACAHVTGVEGDAAMVERAYANAQAHGIQHVDFHCADLSQPPQPSQPWWQPGFTHLVLDPPRSGAQAIVQHVGQLQLDRILYVSCHPATLARDAGILVHQQGFTLAQAGIMDMFPHTQHVEAMALFVR